MNFIVIGAVVLIFLLLLRRLPKAVEIKRQHEPSSATPEEVKNLSLMVQADDAYEARDYNKAEEYYIRAAAQEPNNAKIYNRLGAIYLEDKNYYDAKEAFLQAARLEPDIASRFVNLGLAFMGLKDYFKACQTFQKAIELEPKNKKYAQLFERAKKAREREQKKAKR